MDPGARGYESDSSLLSMLFFLIDHECFGYLILFQIKKIFKKFEHKLSCLKV